MTFLNPIGLIGLLSLPVILALHLLFRRKKRIVVSHLGLWAFLDAETHGPQARRLPLTWILLLDLLLAALLSLALAQPQVAFARLERQPLHRVILLDVSSSMRAGDVSGAGVTSRFEAARRAASDLLADTTTSDVVTVISFGEQARWVADSRDEEGAFGPAWLNERLDQVEVGETGASLLEALALGQSALDPGLPAEFHVFTDGAFPLPEADAQAIRQLAHPLRWHWSGHPADNQSLLELQATPIGANQWQVFARLANFGSLPALRPVELRVDGSRYERSVIDLPAGSTVPHVWNVSLPAGSQPESVEVVLLGSDALAVDDTAALGLQPAGQIRVALVADNPVPLQQALRAIPNVDLRLLSPADYANRQSDFELTIFRGFWPQAWPAGRSLVVEPPAGAASPGGQTFTAGASQAVPPGSLTQAAAEHPLVTGIDFSGVRWARLRVMTAPGAFSPLLRAGGLPILLHGAVERPGGAPGQVTILLADLSQGNFTKHPAFPILMANLVEQSRQAPLLPGFHTGAALPLPGPDGYRSIEITSPGGSPIRLDGDWPERWSDTHEPGLYRFVLTHTDGRQTEFVAGARAGDRFESDLSRQAWTQTLAAPDGRAETDRQPQQQPFDLRAWLLAGAVLIFFLEAVLAWRR